MSPHPDDPYESMEGVPAKQVAFSAHYRMDGHESLCTERHKSLQATLTNAAQDRAEIKAAIGRVESRMWSTVITASFSMIGIIVTLVGGILLFLSK